MKKIHAFVLGLLTVTLMGALTRGSLPGWNRSTDEGKILGIVSGALSWKADGSASLQDAEYFGNGSDGIASITGSTQTIGTWLATGVMQRDVFLQDLTITGSGAINTNGKSIYGIGTLDLSNASAGSIYRTAGTGATSGTQAPGSAGSVTGTNSSCLIGVGNGTAGSSTTTTGNNGLSFSPTSVEGTINGGFGGTGGTDGVRAGGTSASKTAVGLTYKIRRIAPTQGMLAGQAGNVSVSSTSSGCGGSGGAGSGSATGGGGGGGGASPGGIHIGFRTIVRGASTAVGCIKDNGGNGGAGSNATNSNTSGGGGGGGGDGGLVTIIWRYLSGSTATNAIEVNGGNGGVGGNGNGSGGGGYGAQGGIGGAVYLMDLANASFTSSVDSRSGNLGASPSGVSGGTGGTGLTYRVSF